MPQTSQRTARKKAVNLAVVMTGMASLAAGGLLTAAPADAGTNGQQVKVCDSLPYKSFSLRGTNQNGQHASTHFRYTGDNNCVEFTGWWWKGRLTIASGSPEAQLNFYYSIKADLPSTNWYTCYVSASTCIKGLQPG
jgi:hypothetical protein